MKRLLLVMMLSGCRCGSSAVSTAEAGPPLPPLFSTDVVLEPTLSILTPKRHVGEQSGDYDTVCTSPFCTGPLRVWDGNIRAYVKSTVGCRVTIGTLVVDVADDTTQKLQKIDILPTIRQLPLPGALSTGMAIHARVDCPNSAPLEGDLKLDRVAVAEGLSGLYGTSVTADITKNTGLLFHGKKWMDGLELLPELARYYGPDARADAVAFIGRIIDENERIGATCKTDAGSVVLIYREMTVEVWSRAGASVGKRKFSPAEIGCASDRGTPTTTFRVGSNRSAARLVRPDLKDVDDFMAEVLMK